MYNLYIMGKLYVLVFTEYDILIDFKIFGEFDEALKEYIGYSIQETKKLLIDDSLVDESDPENESESEKVSEDDEDITCKLQIFETATNSSEFVLTKEFTIDFFLENVVNDCEGLKEYLEKLEDIVCEDVPVPSDILQVFTKEDS